MGKFKLTINIYIYVYYRILSTWLNIINFRSTNYEKIISQITHEPWPYSYDSILYS